MQYDTRESTIAHQCADLWPSSKVSQYKWRESSLNSANRASDSDKEHVNNHLSRIEGGHTRPSSRQSPTPPIAPYALPHIDTRETLTREGQRAERKRTSARTAASLPARLENQH